jgi:RimJ/RimL family protein N-acetyltransferase
MPVEITKANPKDAWAFLKYVQEEITGYDGIFELSDEQFIATAEGKTVGIATLAYKDRWGKGYSELTTVFVLSGYEGQGIGIRLCTEAVGHFVRLEKTPIACDTSSERMHRVLKRLPPELFEHLRINPSYRTDGDYDVYQMRRDLEELRQLRAEELEDLSQ